MVATHVLGYPRIGRGRALKFALEAFWRGEVEEAHLVQIATGIRAENHASQIGAGLHFVTAGDFSYYDHVLDHVALLGCPPARFGFDPKRLSRGQYFALARGTESEPAMEMTKWFDTNYHHLVPELTSDTDFGEGMGWYFDEVSEALARGQPVKPVLLGPLTFLYLSSAGRDGARHKRIAAIAEAYARVLHRLQQAGVEWVQIDEPALCLDLEPEWHDACAKAYARLARSAPKILLATYFGGIAHQTAHIARLPVNGLHLDFVRAPDTLEHWRTSLPQEWVLSAGIIDGRNVWRADMRRALNMLRPLHDALGERLWLAPSCSLIHVPVTLSGEDRLDAEVRPWLAFAEEKLREITALAIGLEHGDEAIREALDQSDRIQRERAQSARVVNDSVRARVSGVTEAMLHRAQPFTERCRKQRTRLGLPLLPTTTIGSFPQTADIRRTRAAFRRGQLGHLDYLRAMRGEIERAIERQEALGLDVLVHGEPERNDMVEFFAEQLWGYALTQDGWVQSYGSRCVKPPILYGDVYRPEAMTVDTARYAQSLTAKPVKGMLTGPVTLLQWSFVRDDQPRHATALQLALAMRDEVFDLEAAGICIIQIDEPALREGLPLRRKEWDAYLDWAVRAFRLTASIASEETQIHTHMCYAEFSDILPAIAAMDADVVTIEASRSKMMLLESFRNFDYPNGIGPGVYDIHAPRVPQIGEMVRLLEQATAVIPVERLWANPDCGLKTRSWKETEAALRNMVAAAKNVRDRHARM